MSFDNLCYAVVRHSTDVTSCTAPHMDMELDVGPCLQTCNPPRAWVVAMTGSRHLKKALFGTVDLCTLDSKHSDAAAAHHLHL